MYDVANNEMMDAIRIAGTATCSPDRKDMINVVASAVLVMATFSAAAVHKTTICTGIESGRKKYRNLPNAQPAHMSGKI